MYAHYKKLPQLLATCYGNNVYIEDKYFNQENQNEIEHYRMIIKSENKQCVLTPSCDTLYMSNKAFQYPYEDFYVIDYKSDKDFNQLIQYIDSYMNRLNGYGYGGNEVDFIEQFPNLKIEIAQDINNLSGFELYFILSGYQENPDAIMSFIAIPNAKMPSCILDYYGIKFLYDKKIDPLNCVLSIDCQYCDLSLLDKNGSESGSWIPYHNQLKSFDSFKIHDSYDHCVNVIKELILLLQ